MRLRVTLTIVSVVACVSIGCLARPTSHEKTTNNDFDVSVLFDHDGYRVYRFRDGGRAHYYVVPLQPEFAASLTTISTQVDMVLAGKVVVTDQWDDRIETRLREQ